MSVVKVITKVKKKFHHFLFKFSFLKRIVIGSLDLNYTSRVGSSFHGLKFARRQENIRGTIVANTTQKRYNESMKCSNIPKFFADRTIRYVPVGTSLLKKKQERKKLNTI